MLPLPYVSSESAICDSMFAWNAPSDPRASNRSLITWSTTFLEDHGVVDHRELLAAAG